MGLPDPKGIAVSRSSWSAFHSYQRASAWLLASGLAVLLVFAGPQAPAVADTPSPAPTPSDSAVPSVTPSAATVPAVTPGDRPASASPSSNSSVGASVVADRTVKAHPRLSTKGVAKPIRRLVADLRKGVVTEAEAADLAVGMMVRSADVPKRYRLGTVTEYDVMVLGVATGARATAPSVPAKSSRSPRTEQPASSCVYYEDVHSCGYTSIHTQINYVLEYIPHPGGVALDPNVVPDYVTKYAAVSDDAWYYYNTTLGMAPTSDVITIFLDMPVMGNECASWPTDQIFCGSQIQPEGVEYFAAHEMFHQFQWPDVDRDLGSLFALNPWMEATANWASAHFTRHSPRPDGSWNGEAAFISDFFKSTGDGLVDRGNPPITILSGPRAYGAVPAVEYLTEQVGDSLVKESFAAITSDTTDALAPINDALALHYTSLDDLTSGLWWAMYTLCDNQGNDTWDPFGWCADKVFGVMPSGPGPSETRRPDHATVTLSSTPTGASTYSLRRYGAQFVDFDLGELPDNAYGTTLVLRFDSDQVTTDDWVNVVGWKDFPGGEQCATSQLGYPVAGEGQTAVAMQIVGGCRYATLVAVNTHTGTATSATDFPIGWSSFVAGATIGNGTVTLGVNADGNLGLGSPASAVCRPANPQRFSPKFAWESSGQGPALVLNQTGYDAVRRYDPCGEVPPTEGWSVINPNETDNGQPTTWSKHGLDYPLAYSVPVTSFTFSGTDATSIVQLGDDYSLIQHWHPSTVDQRIYQVDITIQSTQLTVPQPSGPATLTYRQVVPLNAGEWDSSDHVDLTRGTDDGVLAVTTNLAWPSNSDYDPGSIDDPLVPLPPSDCDDYGCGGFAFDASVEGLPFVAVPGPSPQLSIFYGFADTTVEAGNLLDTAGATTRAIAQTTDWDANTFAVLVGIHHNT